MKKYTINFLVFGGVLWLLGLTVLLFLQMNKKPILGVIDTHALVMIEAQKIAALHPNNIPAEKLQKMADQLKDRVEELAKKEGFILFAKGAVWGGELPDFTEIMIEKLKKE
jgi:hypothetical protein